MKYINYNFRLTLRNLFKNKFNSIINITVLSVVLFVSVVIMLFVNYHYSFDKQVPNYKNTYRIISSLSEDNRWAATFAAYEVALTDVPEVKSSCVIYKHDEQFDVKVKEQSFHISDPIYVDSGFFTFFNFPIQLGDKSAIESPNSAFISPTMATSLFKDENPIGQTLQIIRNNNGDQRSQQYTVVGVFAAMPKNSHLEYDILLSKNGDFESTINHLKNRKVSASFSYVKLYDDIDPSDFEKKLTSLLIPFLQNAPGPPVEAFKQSLQPLSDIHFTPGLTLEVKPTIRKSHLNILLAIGIVLFVTVVLNFLIMNMVSSKKKRHQTNVIRFLGGSARQIIASSFFEIFVVVFIALIMVIGGLVLFSPTLGSTYLNGWSVDFRSWHLWLLLGGLSTILLFASTLTSSMVGLRKKNANTGSVQHTVPLIVFQFAAVIGILSFTLLVNKQLNYIKNKDLGYTPENVMIWRIPGATDAKINVLKEKVDKIPGVLSSGTAQHYPGFRLQSQNLDTRDGTYDFQFAMLDSNALKTLGINIVEQFNYNEEMSFFINEHFYHQLLKQYTRHQIIDGDFSKDLDPNDTERFNFYINGVVKDFNYSSLYEPINNFVFFVRNPEKYYHRFLMVRANQQQMAEISKQISEVASEIYSGVKLEINYLDEQLNAQYQSEMQLLSIANIFSIITILVACMGLLAFTLFNIQLRTKEVGIRKVNGAKVSEISFFLNRYFLQSMILGFVISVPLAYIAMNQWLSSFAFKVSLSWMLFIAAAIIIAVIAILTISFQSFKAATRNPVEALRYE